MFDPPSRSAIVRATFRMRSWARADSPSRVMAFSSSAMNARRLDGFLKRHRRQNRRYALRQHGLSRARRPDEQNVMPAGAGHFQRALGGLLPMDIAQINGLQRSEEHTSELQSQSNLVCRL